MTGKIRHHQRGSAVIMAVGLLVILGLLGTTFYVITKLDRGEAESLATAAPMKNVAVGELGRILALLAEDLHIDDRGTANTADDLIYGKADTVAKTYDYPHEGVDKWLADHSPRWAEYDPVSGTYSWLWPHVSNLPADLQQVENIWANGVTEVSGTRTHIRNLLDANGRQLYDWVDTDGGGYQVGPNRFDGDAVLYDSGVRDSLGRKFYVAVRVIDASGALNANLASYPVGAEVGSPMPVTDVSLERLLMLAGLTGAEAQERVKAIHEGDGSVSPPVRGRRGLTADSVRDYWSNYALRPLNIGPGGTPSPYMPYDAGDMLALAWRGPVPSTAAGRLWKLLLYPSNPADPDYGKLFWSAKPYLTTHSAGRIVVPRPGFVRRKADLNKAGFSELLTAFSDAIPLGIDGLSKTRFDRIVTATRLALNVVDFRDDDDTPTARSATDGTATVVVCGLERQPFIVEAAYTNKMVLDANQTPIPQPHYAVELFNPYVKLIDTTGWKIQIGTGATAVTENFPVNPFPAYDPGNPSTSGRVVITNGSTDIQLDGPPHAINSLDLKEEVRILRTTTTTDMGVVGKVRPEDFKVRPQDNIPADLADVRSECIRRCDEPRYALYSLALYKTGIADDITTAASNLGKANGITVTPDEVKKAPTDPTPAPTPIYVRNNDFVNVGELNRIFYVCPTGDEAIDVQLAGMSPHDVSNGRLSVFTSMPNPLPPPQDVLGPYHDAKIPGVPLGCMLGDFFMVHSPYADGVDNEGDGKADSADSDGGEDIVYGQLNINTVPEPVLHCLPGLAGLPELPDNVRAKIVKEIIAYRDLLYNAGAVDPATGSGGGADYSNGRQDASVGIANLRREAGFARSGEIAIPIVLRGSKADIPGAGVGEWRLPQNRYTLGNDEPANYTVAEADVTNNPVTTRDDGLSVQGTDRVDGDLVKYLVYHAWLSNHVTVRSDVYVAYIRVDLRVDVAQQPLAVRRYVALIDRSNCRAVSDRPHVLMFAEIN